MLSPTDSAFSRFFYKLGLLVAVTFPLWVVLLIIACLHGCLGGGRPPPERDWKKHPYTEQDYYEEDEGWYDPTPLGGHQP